MENWKPILEFPEHYSVSDQGRVKRIKKGSGAKLNQCLRPGFDRGGYCKIVLSIEGKTCTRNIHNLVAEAFLGPCQDGMIIRHLDGNKRNNVLQNLKYGTPEENMLDSVRHGTCSFGDKHPSSKLTEEQVKCIIEDSRKHKEIAIEYGVSRALVGLIKSGKRRKMRRL